MDATVAVLLTAYDGEKYLREQIESILSQTHGDIRLHIRDDGSNDGTTRILGEYERDPRVSVSYGENIGTTRSIFTLLESAGDAPYYAFSDQDDVWLPDKIERALSRLGPPQSNIPEACFCRLDIVTERLEHIAFTPLYKKPLGLTTAICGNILTGMACVVNKAARDLALCRPPEFTVMYDWWFFIVVSAFGKIYYDEVPSVLYRQHNKNVIGLKTGAGFAAARFKKYARGGYRKRISRQANEFLRLFGEDLGADEKKFLTEFASEKKILRRLAYAARCPAHRQNKFDDALLRALIILNQL